MTAALPDLENVPEVRDLVARELAMDIGVGDATTDAVVPPDLRAAAEIVARAPCVVAGAALAALAMRLRDAGTRAEVAAADGTHAAAGDAVVRIAGRAAAILEAERTAINLLQHMSGVATLTAEFVRRAGRPDLMVLDTRKTLPGLRALEKYAVRCGGGHNHRMGLHDRVLIKDNHRLVWTRRLGRSLADAVRAARAKFPGVCVEVEVEDMAELRDALAAPPDWVLLDNMSPALMAECVRACAGRCRVEASGGIGLANIAAIAATGVDAVSIGALTHSAPAADFSLEFLP